MQGGAEVVVASIGSQFAPRVAPERTVSAIASARRAVLADRYAVNSFAVEWRWFFELGSIEEEWRELAARSLDPNVFYEPGFALAAAPVFGRDAGAVLVWSGTRPRRLLGFFPARVSERRYGMKLPVLVGWTHPYAPLGTPLIERDAAEPVIAAWLAHLGGDPSLPGLLLLPLHAEDGPFAAALGAIVRRAQMPCADFARHRRPLLEPHWDRLHYLERTVSRHRRKELARTGRRLADAGALLFTATREPAGVNAALEDFFALEASGWKGKAGTAASRDAGLQDFIRRRSARSQRTVKSRSTVSCSTDAPSPPAITLRSADAAWYWKTAYDESLARFAPGMLLTAALTEELAEDESIARTDSVLAPGNPDARPHLARAHGAVRPLDRGAAGGAVCTRLPAGNVARRRAQRGQVDARAAHRRALTFAARFPRSLATAGNASDFAKPMANPITIRMGGYGPPTTSFSKSLKLIGDTSRGRVRRPHRREVCLEHHGFRLSRRGDFVAGRGRRAHARLSIVELSDRPCC